MKSSNKVYVLFFLLQSLFFAMYCMIFAFIAPALHRFGYTPLQTGMTLTLAACSAMLAQPLWGYFNDKKSCSKQVVFGATAFACATYIAFVNSGGNALVISLCIVGMHGTMNCMGGFIDAWTAKLIAEGYEVNYGVTRSGGSFAYAVTAMIFGVVIQRMGMQIAPIFVWGLFVAFAAVLYLLPNPEKVHFGQRISMKEAVRYLLASRIYLLLLAAYFLRTFTSSAMDNFFSLAVIDLGGSESQVGFALFLMAMCELPFMIFYRRIKACVGWSSSIFLGLSMLFFAIKSLLMGLAPTYPLFLAAITLQCLSFAMFIPAYIDFMIEHVDKKYLSTAQLLAAAIGGSLASIIANSVNGWIADAFGVQMMLRVAAIPALFGALIIFIPALAARRKRRAVPHD